MKSFPQNLLDLSRFRFPVPLSFSADTARMGDQATAKDLRGVLLAVNFGARIKDY
jgi:hypothetical protein